MALEARSSATPPPLALVGAPLAHEKQAVHAWYAAADGDGRAELLKLAVPFTLCEIKAGAPRD